MKNLKNKNNKFKLNFPLISVLIPVYNSEKFLKKCLDSIINQSYKNIEIICIDDASKDNSFNILKFYEKHDNRVKVNQNKKNIGENQTRKKLIDKINGEFFLFIDSDDYINKNMIEKMYLTITKDKSDLVECNVNMIKKGKRKTDFTIKKFGVFSPKKYINQYQAVLWNKLFKTEIINTNKINFPDEKYITCGFDKFFNFEYITSSKKISVIPDKLYNYVIHDSSTLSTMKDHQILSDFYSINKCYDFLHYRNLFKIFYKDFLNLSHKFKSKLLKCDPFFKEASTQLHILRRKIYLNYKFLYFISIILNGCKSIFSIQSSLSGAHKIITIIGFKLKINK